MKVRMIFKPFSAQIGWVITLGALFCLTFTSISSAETPDTESASTTTTINNPPLEDIQRFTNAISHIKNYYVNTVPDKKLFENAIRGMLQGLDPHSAYLDEKDFKDLNATTRGEFSGLGLEVTMDDETIKVISPLDDSPAAKAGIKPGDRIIMLDNQPIKGMSLRDAVEKMRGDAGSSIRLTIIRDKEPKPLIFDVVRKVIEVKSVKGELIDKKFAYIRVSHFQMNTANDVKSTLALLKKKAGGKLSGLILDLRNNPGGLLDSAVDIADAFIDKAPNEKQKLIVYTKGRMPDSQLSAYAKPGDLMKGLPIVILINEGSASGSEIVAGALQDYKRALLIGMRTFGKGSVQTVLPLDDTHGLKLTTALYYTPLGRSIQARGITPDIEIASIDVTKAKDDGFKAIQESDLAEHLSNGDDELEKEQNKITTMTAPPKDKTGDKEHSSEDLVYEDFQLYQALILLKSMALKNPK